MPDGDGLTDDFLGPSGANFEVNRLVQSFDVPLTWTNRIPVAQAQAQPTSCRTALSKRSDP